MEKGDAEVLDGRREGAILFDCLKVPVRVGASGKSLAWKKVILVDPVERVAGEVDYEHQLEG